MATKERSREEKERDKTSSPGKDQRGGIQNPTREKEEKQSREKGGTEGGRSDSNRGKEERR